MKPVALFHRQVFRLQQAKQHLQLRKSVSSRLSTWLDLMTVKTRRIVCGGKDEEKGTRARCTNVPTPATTSCFHPVRPSLFISSLRFSFLDSTRWSRTSIFFLFSSSWSSAQVERETARTQPLVAENVQHIKCGKGNRNDPDIHTVFLDSVYIKHSSYFIASEAVLARAAFIWPLCLRTYHHYANYRGR